MSRSVQAHLKRTALLGALFTVLAVGGCSSADRGVVTVEFWAMGREGEAVQKLLPAFEREHPNVRVEVQQIPWSAAHEKLLTAYAGDATPDLCQLGNTWIPEFVAMKALATLDPWLERTEVVDSLDYFSGIWATNVLDGQVYGVPWYVDTRLLFYRKDLLAQVGFPEPPATWSAWQTAMRRIAQQGEEQYAVLLPTNEFEPPIIFALQQGAEMLRDQATYGHFTGPRFRRAFEFYVDIFRNGWAPAIPNTQVSNMYQEFARGRFAFLMTGPWNLGEFRKRLPEELQDDWMTAPLPGPGEQYPGVSVAGGASLVVFQASEHKEEAWKLIEFLSAPEQQVRFHEITGNLPPRRAAWAAPTLASNVYARAFRTQLQHVEPVPQLPEWERIATMISDYAERVIHGRLSVDEALHALNRDVNQVLEKRRWLLKEGS